MTNRLHRESGIPVNIIQADSVGSLFLDKPFLPIALRPKCKVTSNLVPRNDFACDEKAKYQRINGDCNNLNHPSHGAAQIEMRRFTKPAYADGRKTFKYQS